ncbi:MAG: Nif3-like dinuclear metal center hexameric protein [Phycisphaerales bacterium]|nr:Nif3-like dinuclear metal center hexameric protein [Phycisphaerales bacterium]
MHVQDLIAAIERFAPTHLAETWDNVGLIIGSRQRELSGKVLLTIDLTERVADEAIAAKASAIIAYHPPIFQPIKRIIDGQGSSVAQRVALRLIEHRVAVYSPHTALDATPGGMTDWLADGVLDPVAARAVKPGEVLRSGGDRRALRPASPPRVTEQLKIVTFVPHDAIERVRGALASAGAGIIGNYEVCSFATPGHGTFRGGEVSHPAVGVPGTFQTVQEVRLEMVCARRALPIALATLSEFHPYEEPAIDVYPLEPKPQRGTGSGRRVTLDHDLPLRDIAQRVRDHIGVKGVEVAAAGGDLGAHVSRIAVVPGAGAELVEAALADGCQVLVTGEMKHHEVNAAISAGLSIILGGHTPTERGYLPRFAGVLKSAMPSVEFAVSSTDVDPLVRV